MTLVRRNSIRPTSFDRLFNDLAKDFFAPTTVATNTSHNTRPSVNIIEDEHNYVLEVAAPGLKKEHFELKVDKNTLTIKGEKKVEETASTEKFLRREFGYQSFERSFTLAEDKVEAQDIHATYSEGVLKVTLPKKAEAKAEEPKLIEVA